HVGYVRAGWRGLIPAGTAFILPAATITRFFAGSYVRYGTPTSGERLLDGHHRGRRSGTLEPRTDRDQGRPERRGRCRGVCALSDRRQRNRLAVRRRPPARRTRQRCRRG